MRKLNMAPTQMHLIMVLDTGHRTWNNIVMSVTKNTGKLDTFLFLNGLMTLLGHNLSVMQSNKGVNYIQEWRIIKHDI